MTELTPQTLIKFLTFAEGLKNTLRHSYTSQGRRESVAEHTWTLTLLAMLVFDQLQEPVDQLKVLKLLIVHDLPEIITGDIPAFDKLQQLEQAQAAEAEALVRIEAMLPAPWGREIAMLCDEFEARQTPEARLAYAIDKAEAFIQHNIADISTWDQNDFDYQTDLQSPRREHFNFDPYMAALRDQIDADTLQKIAAAGLLHRANQQTVRQFNGDSGMA